MVAVLAGFASEAGLPVFYMRSSGGTVVQRSVCLSLPEDCAWHVDHGTRQLRNLESTRFLCTDTDGAEGMLVVRSSPCPAPFDDWLPLLEGEGRLYAWETQLLVRSARAIPDDHLELEFSLEHKAVEDGAPTEFTLLFEGPGSDPVDQDRNVTIRDLSFLTVNRLQVPCACAQSLEIQNQTTLNREWWRQETFRTPRSLPAIGRGALAQKRGGQG